MAYNTNYTFWMTTNNDLKDLLLRQYAARKLKITTRLSVHDILAELYARYVVIVNKLGYLFDQTLQVQKRALIRKLLEAATRRLFELRNELKKLELSEFIYIDKTLVQRKLIPQDIQLMRPFYFPYQRSEEIDEIINGPRIEEKLPFEDADLLTPRSSVTSVVSNVEKSFSRKKKKVRPIVQDEPTVQLTPEEQAKKDAIIRIQAHERARQSRVWLTNIKTNPEKYGPKMPEITDKYKYEFMHKPTQTMLIPVRRTKFDANYYVDAKEQKKFDYYSKPSNEIKKIPSETFAERTEDVLSVKISTDIFDRPSICMDYLKAGRKRLNRLSDFDSIHAENYFLEGMLKYDCDVEFKTLSEESVLDPVIAQAVAQRVKEYNAACLIQKAWHEYKTRRYFREKALQRNILYGMYDERKFRIDVNKDLKEHQRQRRLRKAIFDQAFIQACEDEKARILKVRASWIMEDISDSIRAWFREFYDIAKEFDEYPKELKGGTVLVVKGETLTVPEFIKKKSEKKKTKEQKKKEAEKRKAELAKEKEKAKKAKLLAKRKADQLRKAGGIAIDFASITDHPNVKEIEKTLLEYDVEWQHIDEKNNIKEDPYMHWITMEKFDEVYKELRITVDEFMRAEYILLQMALAKDRKKKYKPKKEKRKRGKDKKKNKGKKGKKVKDITADRTTASLYYEMVDAGLIKKYPKRDFDEFIGDYNYCAYEIRNFLDMDTPPSKGEIKDILRECIAGMGPLNIPKPKSILLAGTINSGKTLLLEILATEIDAMMIDLSPEVVVKFADRMPYLIHLVTKMAKLLEPTLIIIEGVHRVFWKKIPKDQMVLNPRLLSKYLQKKVIKPIKKEDKILVVGTTEAPFQAKGRMKKAFQKIILLPNTDYGTAFLLWRSKTLSMLGIPRDFDFSPLAKVTKAYETGDICKNIEETLNIRRRLKLSRQPIKHMEFLDYFLNRPEPCFPPKEEDYGKFLKWFTKVDKLTKQRAKYLKQAQEAKNKNEKKGGK